MKYNCKSCLFANFMKDGGVYCDRRILEGVKVYIENNKVDLNCSCHSNYLREETRYNRLWRWHNEADDVCQICGRDLDLDDEKQYKYVDIEYKDENGNVKKKTIRKCSICISKGR